MSSELIIRIIILIISALLAILAWNLITKPKKGNTTIVETGFPLEYTITGPRFGLPEGLVIEYRYATRSPEVALYFDAEGTQTGWTINFGSGLIGYRYGELVNYPDTLQFKMSGPQGNVEYWFDE